MMFKYLLTLDIVESGNYYMTKKKKTTNNCAAVSHVFAAKCCWCLSNRHDLPCRDEI